MRVSPLVVRALTVGLLWIGTGSLRAELTTWKITERKPYVNGQPLGQVGPYEHWRGEVAFAVDPQGAANRSIVDLDLAPRNAQGRVEFRGEFEMLVPADRGKANGTLFYEVNNRGRKTALNMFHGGNDDFLLRHGFIVLWSGWIGEVIPIEDRLLFQAPVAHENGRPVRGIVRADLVIEQAAPTAPLAHRAGQGSYPPVVESLPSATATMRERESDPRVVIPRDQWRLNVREVKDGDRRGQLPVVELVVDGGLKPGFIYEVIYEAEGSLVQGTGMAAIRDVISALKHERGARNPLLTAEGKPIVERALGFGTSQSGRLLRHFLYEGFNADEQGRIVFDGVMSHVAGGGLGCFNQRFAAPTRTNGQHEEHSFPADYFPFTYGDSTDPHTGSADGILRRARQSGTVPKLMHTQSSSEYWHRSGSLVHTDPLGRADAELPDDVRVYTFGGTQHGPGNGRPAPRAFGQLPSNPADYRPVLRGLLMALDAWVRNGQAPPASVYPRFADGSLVDWPASSSGWRAVPGVEYPRVIQQPVLFDRGPRWATERIATIEPPRPLQAYGVRVPAYGPDNNERGVLNVPAVAVPVASYTSWNLRHPSVGAAGELLGLQGGYIPFPRDRAAREKAGDPRPSLVERYGSFADYERQYLAAAERLIAERYMLAEELPGLKQLLSEQRARFE